jgi:hypothetical protein
MNIISTILGMFSIKRLAVWLIVALLFFLLRGGLFRQVSSYSAEKRFKEVYNIDDPRLANYILKHPEVYDREVKDVEQIALIAEKITSDVLYFSKDSSVFNPNVLFLNGGATNDAGFSAFYAAVCNYLINYYSLKDYYYCLHYVGSCFFMKTNLTTFRTIRGGKPFPSEYHFNIIINLKTNEMIAVDPSLYEAYCISPVSFIERVKTKP